MLKKTKSEKARYKRTKKNVEWRRGKAHGEGLQERRPYKARCHWNRDFMFVLQIVFLNRFGLP